MSERPPTRWTTTPLAFRGRDATADRPAPAYGPFTRQFLAGAGVTAGMKVLDVAGTVRSLLPFLERMAWCGLTTSTSTPWRTGCGTRSPGQDGIQLLPAVMGAWART